MWDGSKIDIELLQAILLYAKMFGMSLDRCSKDGGTNLNQLQETNTRQPKIDVIAELPSFADVWATPKLIHRFTLYAFLLEKKQQLPVDMV